MYFWYYDLIKSIEYSNKVRQLSFFYALLFFLSHFIYSIFIYNYFNEIPGLLQDRITSRLFDILAMYLHISNKNWIYFIGLSTCCDFIFFHLLESVFQLSSINLSKSNQFLLYCILPVNSISSLSGSKHFYYTFYLLLISICIQKLCFFYIIKYHIFTETSILKH